MGKKVVVFDSVFWLGFVCVAAAFIWQSQVLAVLGIILQAASLGGVWIGLLPGRIPAAKNAPEQQGMKSIVLSPEPLKGVAKQRFSFRSLFNKQVSGAAAVKKDVQVI